jgi:hypothetical protein
MKKLPVAVCIFLIALTTAVAASGQTKPSIAPSGLAVVRPVLNSQQNDQALKAVLNNTFISGIAFQIAWRDVEPAQGKLDWSQLDELFAEAEAARKWVQLVVYPGFFTPEWALAGVKTEEFPIPYGPGHGKLEKLPTPWNEIYLKRWYQFLRQLSERYEKSPAFVVIAAGGPTSVSEEMTLPQSPEDLKKWQLDGYTPRKYTEAWEDTLQVYASVFPNQFVSLSVGSGIKLNEQGKIEPRQGIRTRQAIIDHAIRLLGSRFILQNSDLHGGPDQHPATAFVMGYTARINTGLEMRCPAERGSLAMGAESDPPLALRKSIDKGVPNKPGPHVKYLEIYEADVLADEMQPVLRYGASLFPR